MAEHGERRGREFDLLDLPVIRQVAEFFRTHPRVALTAKVFCVAVLAGLILLAARMEWNFGRRWVAVAMAAALIIFCVGILGRWRRRTLQVVGGIALLLSLLAGTVRLEVVHGDGHGVRIVPIVYGFPNDETLERLRRGEVVWGGCELGPEILAVIIEVPRASEGP